MTRDLFAILVTSLLIAVACGVGLFFRAPAHRSLLLDVAFGLSAAVFLGALIVVLLRRAAASVDEEDDDPPPRPRPRPPQSERRFTQSSAPSRKRLPRS